MELKSKWVVIDAAVQVVRGVLHGGRTGRSHSPWARTTMPAGCWPVVRFTPTQPWTRRSFSVLPHVDAPLLQVLAHIAIGGLVRQGAAWCLPGTRAPSPKSSTT